MDKLNGFIVSPSKIKRRVAKVTLTAIDNLLSRAREQVKVIQRKCAPFHPSMSTDTESAVHHHGMKRARLLVVVIGILLPYLARIPGMFFKGSEWMTSYFESPLIVGVTLIPMVLCWGGILQATSGFRHASSVWFPAIFGFFLPALGNAGIDLETNMAAIAVMFFPIYSLPLIFVGWLLGRSFDRDQSERP